METIQGWLPQIPLPRAALRILTMCVFCVFLMYSSLLFSYPVSHLVPVVKPDPLRIPSRPFNDSKVALLIEDRPIAHLAPLLLHMISVVPPDWRFVFLGSVESVAFLNNSLAVRTQVRSGKLDLGELPRNFSSKGKEPLSQTLTSVEFWRWLGGKDTWDWKDPYVDEEGEEPNGMAPGRRPQVEWVLIFQTDSILCANSKASLNDWLHYDWVGAPWRMKDPYGGNGGLSLRRVSRMIQVLNFQKRPVGFWELEDLWLVQRIGILPGARMANTTTESHFSVEHVWSDEPMGYHLGSSGALLPVGVWNSRKQREKIWNWCPEIKLILNMRLERECQDGKHYGAWKNPWRGAGTAGNERREEWPSFIPW